MNMPNEIIEEITSNLRGRDLDTSLFVCRKLHDVVSDQMRRMTGKQEKLGREIADDMATALDNAFAISRNPAHAWRLTKRIENEIQLPHLQAQLLTRFAQAAAEQPPQNAAILEIAPWRAKRPTPHRQVFNIVQNTVSSLQVTRPGPLAALIPMLRGMRRDEQLRSATILQREIMKLPNEHRIELLRKLKEQINGPDFEATPLLGSRASLISLRAQRRRLVRTLTRQIEALDVEMVDSSIWRLSRLGRAEQLDEAETIRARIMQLGSPYRIGLLATLRYKVGLLPVEAFPSTEHRNKLLEMYDDEIRNLQLQEALETENERLGAAFH